MKLMIFAIIITLIQALYGRTMYKYGKQAGKAYAYIELLNDMERITKEKETK